MVDLAVAGMVVALAGLAMVAVSMVISAKKAGGEVRGGGVVMVGPIPIIFGSDTKWASVAIVLAIVLILLTFLLNLV